MKIKQLLFLLFFLAFQHSAIKAENIALYMGSCADFGSSCFSEGTNLNAYLISQGHTVTTFTGNVPASLNDVDVLYYPEFETCLPALSAAENTAINDYVDAGGGIIVHGNNSGLGRYASFLNSIFSLGLVAVDGSSSDYTLNASQTAGTRFEGCAAQIPDLNATDLLVSSMPSNKVCIYEDGVGTAVATIPFGRGEIRFIGWDYFNGGLGCPLENADWNTLINKMITPFNEEQAIPTLSEWGLMVFGLLIINLGVFSIRRKEQIFA